jgi:hypothetical protein
MRPLRGHISGERVSNTLVTCPEDGDNYWKRWLIPDVLGDPFRRVKAPVLRDGPAAYQLVGRVMAYQGEDG